MVGHIRYCDNIRYFDIGVSEENQVEVAEDTWLTIENYIFLQFFRIWRKQRGESESESCCSI